MYLTHALRAILRTAVATGDALWKYVSLLLSGTPPTQTFIADASVNANVLTLNGDVRPSNLNPYVEGYYSNYFDGTGDTINLPTSTALLGAGNYTVEFWVNLPAAPTGGAYFTVFAWGSSGSVLRCFLLNETVTKLGVWIGATNVVLYPTSAMVGQWAHIALVRSGTTLTAYINGVSVATASDATNYNTGQLYIASQAATNFLTGYISNFRIVVGTAVYTANFTPPTAPLTAISGTSLLTCQSNRFIDNSANNFALTRAGDVAVRGFVPFTPPTTVNVNTLYSTYFDGSGDYLSVPANSVFQFVGDYTIEFWVNFGTVTGNQDLISNYNAGGAADWIVMMSATGIQYYPSSASSYVYTGAGSVISNTWYHVAAVRSGNTCSLYLNGVSVGTPLTFSGTLGDNTKPIYIGSRTGTGGYFTGCMSNLRVVKGTAVYTTNFTPPTSPLTAISGTSLLTCQNATIIDNSTNALAITSFGQAQPVDVSPFTQVTTPVTATYLGSAYFDGSGDYLSATGSALGAGAFTIEMWVYMTSYPNSQNALYSNGTSDSTSSIAAVVYINSSGTLAIYNYPNSITTSTTVPLNQWNHIAVVRNSGTVSLYINGVNGGSGSNSNNITNTAVQVMRGFGGILNSPIGYVSDVRVVKGTALYTANFAPPATPLTAVANTSLLTLQTDQPAANKQFVDNSGSNLVITQAGNATQGSFSPYGANWSNYFDGSGDYINSATAPSYLAVGTGAITLEAWVFITQTGAWQGAVSTVPGDVSGNGINIGISNTNKLRSSVGNGGAGLDLTDTADFVFNTWVHIAVTRAANGAVTLYKNGVSVATGTSSTSLTANGVIVGRFYTNLDTNYLRGYISNARISNTVRTITVPTAPYTPDANTLLLTCQSASIIDTSDRALPLTRGGDTNVQRFSPFSPVIQAPVSYSTYFDGSGDYLFLPTSNVDDLSKFLTSNFTVECWVYSTSISGDRTVISAVVSWGDGANYNIEIRNGLMHVQLGNGVTMTSGTISISANTWTHIALVRSGLTSTTVYVNGVSSATYTSNWTADENCPLTIGCFNVNGGSLSNYWQGYISNVRITKGTALYTANFTPPTAPLTAISGTSLLTCQSPTIVDNSPNAFTVTSFGNSIARIHNPFGFTNTTTDTAYTPALYGGSAYFDGTGDYLNTPSLISASGDFTLECWFNTTIAVSGYRMLCGGAIDTSASNYLAIYASGVEAQFGAGAATVTTAAYTFTPNTWYHVAMTRSGTTIRMFVNGVSLTTSQGSQAGTFAIRYIANGYAGLIYTGYMADLRFVLGQALYTGGFVPPIAPLQAVKNTTLLLNMDKSGITDSSRCVDLETVGDAKIRYESPYNGNYYSNYFDGSGDSLTTTANAAFGFGTGDFTVEFWVNFTSTVGRQDLVWWGVSSSDRGGLIWNITAGNLTYYISPTVANAINYAWTPITNTWYHIALTRSSGSSKLFINGVQGGSTYTDTKNYSVNNLITVGQDSGAASSYFNGYMSNLLIVKGTAVYTANFTPPTAPLTAVAGTSLLTCQSKSFVDNSSNNFTITRNGDVAVRSLNPFQANIANSSMYFDGSGDSLKAPYNPSYSLPGDFTVESWVYLTSAVGTGNQTIASFGYLNSTGVGPWGFYLNGSGPYTLYFNSSTGNKFTSTTVAIPVGTWNHVTYCRSGSTGRFFVNGTIVGATISDTFTYSGTTESLYVGTMGDGATAPLYGYLADFRITKSARYTANFTPPTAPLPTA